MSAETPTPLLTAAGLLPAIVKEAERRNLADFKISLVAARALVHDLARLRSALMQAADDLDEEGCALASGNAYIAATHGVGESLRLEDMYLPQTVELLRSIRPRPAAWEDYPSASALRACKGRKDGVCSFGFEDEKCCGWERP